MKRRVNYPAVALAAIFLGLLSGCEKRTVGPIDTSFIPFELTIPDNTPQGDFYAVSGILIKDELSAGDTTQQRYPRTSYYAQFRSRLPGVQMPAVLLNNVLLDHHNNGDTLRLKNAAAAGILEVNTWRLIAPGATDTVKLTADVVSVLDSLDPFTANKIIRSDTALTITWPRATAPGGILLIWKKDPAGSYTYTAQLTDGLGSFTVPVTELKKLRGNGSVTLVRYRFFNYPNSYLGQTVSVVRLAQRTYPTVIQ